MQTTNEVNLRISNLTNEKIGVATVETIGEYGSYFYDHGRQLLKGVAGVLGLATLGGLAYTGLRWLGLSQSNNSDAPTKVQIKVDSTMQPEEYEVVVADSNSKHISPYDFSVHENINTNIISSEKSVSNSNNMLAAKDNIDINLNLEYIEHKNFKSLQQKNMRYSERDIVFRDSLLTSIDEVGSSQSPGGPFFVKVYGGASQNCNSEAEEAWPTNDNGLIVFGYTTCPGIGNADFAILKLDNFGAVNWGKVLGFSGGTAGAYSGRQTADGGYIIGGYGKASSDIDFLILKLDSSASKSWAKTFGTGGSEDQATSVQQTKDGGYIVLGVINSGAWQTDIGVLKLTSSGDKSWAKRFDAGHDDQAWSIQQTTDDGYVIAGFTDAPEGGSGVYDVLIMKLDSSGNKSWVKTIGPINSYVFRNEHLEVQQTKDGGYIYAGHRRLTGNGLVLKLDGSGNKVWWKELSGGVGNDVFTVRQASDGGYIVAGCGGGSVSIVKLDSSGNNMWTTSFGNGDGTALSYAVRQTNDGGYVLVGYTDIFSTGRSVLVIKLTANGICKYNCFNRGWGWYSTDSSVAETSSTWTVTDLSWSTADASSVTYQNWYPTITTVCNETLPVANIALQAQSGCCSASVGIPYNFVFDPNTFTDQDGDLLTYTAGQNGVGNLPEWISFNQTTRTFAGTANNAVQIKNMIIRVNATDPSSAMATDSFSLNVLPSLNATNTGGTINYIENTNYNLADIVISTPSASVSSQLQFNNTAAGRFSTGTSGSVTSTFNSTTGTWLASGNKADVNTLIASIQYLPAPSFYSPFSIAVSITDSYSQKMVDTILAKGHACPVLVNNHLTVYQGQMVPVTKVMFSVTDSDTPQSELYFTVSNVQHGQFTKISDLGVALSVFTPDQIQSGSIRFIHDNSMIVPGYQVSVSDGFATTTPVSGIVTFDISPVLINNYLVICQKQSVTMSSNFLSAIDFNDNNAALVFGVSSIQHGHFEYISAPQVPINSFLQANITAGVVRFVHDGTQIAPSYQVDVSDGLLTTSKASALITFDVAPTLLINQLSITQGVTVVINGNMLSATDPDTLTDNLIFNISSILHGYFELVSKPGLSATMFPQSEIVASNVLFKHDGGDSAPEYYVSVSDGLVSTTQNKALVTFRLNQETEDHTVRNALLSSLITGGIGFGLWLFKMYVDHKTKEKFNLPGSLKHCICDAIIRRMNITGCMGYISDGERENFLNHAKELITGLQGYDNRLDARISANDADLANEIAEQIQNVVIGKRTFCQSTVTFFKNFCVPEILPSQLCEPGNIEKIAVNLCEVQDRKDRTAENLERIKKLKKIRGSERNIQDYDTATAETADQKAPKGEYEMTSLSISSASSISNSSSNTISSLSSTVNTTGSNVVVSTHIASTLSIAEVKNEQPSTKNSAYSASTVATLFANGSELGSIDSSNSEFKKGLKLPLLESQ